MTLPSDFSNPLIFLTAVAPQRWPLYVYAPLPGQGRSSSFSSLFFTLVIIRGMMMRGFFVSGRFFFLFFCFVFALGHCRLALALWTFVRFVGVLIRGFFSFFFVLFVASLDVDFGYLWVARFVLSFLFFLCFVLFFLSCHFAIQF